MPARATARSNPSATRKSSVQPSGRAGSVTPSFAIPEEPPLPETSPSLRRDVCSIFADAQRSTTGHRKLVVRLRKLQEICCGILNKKSKDNKGQEKLSLPTEETWQEKEFNVEVGRCLLRILPIKKTEPVGDRILRFVGTFLSHTSEKDGELFGSEEEDDITAETPTARLATSLVSVIVPLLMAKDKVVRFRATQIVAHIVNSLDSIDDDLYHTIRQGLLKRIRDKEPSVRVQAVMGLGRLAGNDEDEDNDDNTALLERLIDIMQNDTGGEVRKTLLTNLPLTPGTLPYLLERARDLDAATRRALYSKLLPTLGDFRHLSLSMREKLMRWGLRDRDESVRKATGKLFYDRWVEDCAGTNANNEEEAGPTFKRSPPNIPALLELLERIDVVNSGMESGIAHEAMRSFWEGRADYREAVVFDEPFWESLTAESSFLLRSFNDFCRVEHDGKYDNLADEKMPEVTALAHYLQKYMNELLERKKTAKESGEANDEDSMEQEFVVEQLLHITLTMDYSDEVGRRKMFSLLRESLAVPELPEESTKLIIETLRCVCGPELAAEGEFCSVVLEAIAEVHDTISTEDSFVSARSEISDAESSSRQRSETPGSETEQPAFNKEEAKAKILKEIVVNMKCLHIALCMLQNVEGNLQQNVNLVTMLNNLVVPAVRSHEAPIRERGLECLGLCCLLDKTLAEENMTLFIHCYSKGHEALQVTALQILCDMLTTHPTLLAPVTQPDGETVSPPMFHKPLLKAFARALKSNSPNNVQSTAATALSKLLLTSAFAPSGSNVPPAIQEMNQTAIETLLLSLVVSFFHPRTKENPALRQSLAYFFPVYCHSRITNTLHMQKIAVPVVRAVMNSAEEYYSLEAEEDSDGEIDETAGQRELKTLMTGVLGMLAEWTDERRVVGLGGENVLTGGTASSNACGWVHLALVKDILERVLGISTGTHRLSKDEKKLLFSLMSKLYIAPPPPPPAAPSRAGSRQPEGAGDDPFRTSQHSNQAEPISPDNAQLAQQVKELLDQAIEDGVAGEAAGRNALVKVKNVILKLLASAQGTRAPSGQGREGTEEPDDDMMSVRSGRSMSVRSGSVRPSIEPGLARQRRVSIEPSIMEEDEPDENEYSRATGVQQEEE